MQKNRPEGNYWSYRDVDAMAYMTGCAPVFIDAVKGQSRLTSRRDSRQYMYAHVQTLTRCAYA